MMTHRISQESVSLDSDEIPLEAELDIANISIISEFISLSRVEIERFFIPNLILDLGL